MDTPVRTTKFSPTHTEYSPLPRQVVIQPTLNTGGARRPRAKRVNPRGVPKKRRVGRFIAKNKKVAKRGRKPLWTPHAATDADLQAGQALMKLWGISTSNATRVLDSIHTPACGFKLQFVS